MAAMVSARIAASTAGGLADDAIQSQWVDGGGTSSAGLESKKPTGIRWNPQYSTGITGQSSGRGEWETPKVCQATMSVSTRERSADVHLGRPSPPRCWFG